MNRPNGKPQIVSVHTTASSKLFVIEAVKLVFTNGHQAEYERVSSTLLRGAVIIVPVLDSESFLLVNEYVVGFDRYELSLPKGLVQEGENVIAAANRELMEETGYCASRLVKIHTLSLAAGFMCYETDVILAANLSPRSLPGDEPEALEKVTCSWRELDEIVASGRITDARSIAALYVARNRIAQEGAAGESELRRELS